MPPTIEAESPSIPAVAQHGPEGIAAFAQQTRHIERLVAQTVIVTGPSRVQDVVAGGSAVELRLVDAQRRHVQPRPPHTRTNVELTAQQRT